VDELRTNHDDPVMGMGSDEDDDDDEFEEQEETDPKKLKKLPEYVDDGIPLIELSLPELDGKRIVYPLMMWGDSPWRKSMKKMIQEYRDYIEDRFSTLELADIFVEKVGLDYDLGGRTSHEVTVLGLVKGVWKLMRSLRLELKTAGRKWMKVYFFPLAGAKSNIHYRMEGSNTFVMATKSKDVYKSWFEDWSDGNIRRQHHFWDHLLQSMIGWEGTVLEWLMTEVGLVFDVGAMDRFENGNITGYHEDGKPIRRRGPKEKNTFLCPFKKQHKDARDYLRNKNIENRDFKRKEGSKGQSGMSGKVLAECMVKIVEFNKIKIAMRPENIYHETAAAGGGQR
jgi:hypothetical protein